GDWYAIAARHARHPVNERGGATLDHEGEDGPLRLVLEGEVRGRGRRGECSRHDSVGIGECLGVRRAAGAAGGREHENGGGEGKAEPGAHSWVIWEVHAAEPTVHLTRHKGAAPGTARGRTGAVDS